MPRKTTALNAAGRRSGGARGPARPRATTARLLSFADLERVYGPPASSWRSLVLRGELSVIRLGSRCWVDRATAEAYLVRMTERTS
jgi:hypothetical protein